MASTDTSQASTRVRKPRNRKAPTNAPTRPTVTDQEHKELLDIRSAAMKGFTAGTVDSATKNAARKAVRDSRKVRNLEEETGVLPTWRAWEASEAERVAKEQEAKVAARKPRSRAKKAAEPKVESEPVVNPDAEAPLVEVEEEENEIAA